MLLQHFAPLLLALLLFAPRPQSRPSIAGHWSAIIEPIAANSRPNENCVERMTARNSSVRIRMIEPVRFRYSDEHTGHQRAEVAAGAELLAGSARRSNTSARNAALQLYSSPPPIALV